MQEYTYIPQDKYLSDSRQLIVDNFLTVMSCNSGDSFPATNLQLGMLCFRTDQLKLYCLTNTTMIVWLLVMDLTQTPTSKDYVDATFSQKGHTHVKENITDFAHTHVGSEIQKATTSNTGVVSVGSGLLVDAQGLLKVNPNEVSIINPTTPVNGAIRVLSGKAYVYIDGSYKQIYPNSYSS